MRWATSDAASSPIARLILRKPRAAVQASMLARAPEFWIARLEDEIGSTRLREVRDVLPRATRDLKNQAAQRQVALQHLKYRFSVAGYGRCVASGILCHIWFAA